MPVVQESRPKRERDSGEVKLEKRILQETRGTRSYCLASTNARHLMVSNICRYSIVSYTLCADVAQSKFQRVDQREREEDRDPRACRELDHGIPVLLTWRKRVGAERGGRPPGAICRGRRHPGLRLAFRVFSLVSFRLRVDLVHSPRPGELRGREPL